jgi:hypothetical protein
VRLPSLVGERFGSLRIAGGAMNRILPNLALLAFSLALAGGVSEVVLRARFGAPPVWTYPQESYLPDAEAGFRLAPDQHAFTHDQPVQINSLGMRDRDYPRAPAPGVKRLMALGDSQTFGNGLALGENWPKRLEGELQRSGSGSGTWEVINAGVPGTAPWQQYILLRRTIDACNIDGIVLGFYVNDVVPITASSEDSARELTNTWSKRVGYALKRSALLLAAWNVRDPIRAFISRKRDTWEENILTGKPDPRIDEGWRQVEQSLAEMKRFADERHLGFWLVALPRRDQVSGAQPGRAYQHRISEISAELGIHFVDPLPALERSYAEHGDRLFVPWDGHNSGLANQVIAAELARSISGAG